MYIQDHQIKFENYDTNQKNIIISALLFPWNIFHYFKI